MSEDPRHIESCRGFIKFLEAAVKNMAVYPPEHPSVRGVSQRAYEHLAQALEGKGEIPLGIVNGVLFVDDYYFTEATPYSDNFMKILNSFEIDDLIITNGVTQEDVLNFAAILKSTDHNREEFPNLAEKVGLKRIGIKGSVVTPEEVDFVEEIVKTYRDAIDTVSGFFTDVVQGRLPSLEQSQYLVERFAKYMTMDRETLLLLTSLKGYERYTEQHCVNVCILAMLLAEEEGLDKQAVEWAAMAGLMHDAGMVKVPREVAEKPGSLTLGERETFKSHPVHSAGIIHGMEGPDEVVFAVERHHVLHGGGGYPAGVESEQSPPLAGIVSVADTYDAVTSLRPYKRSMNPIQALAFLEKGRGTRFDPVHIDAFKSLTGPWPPGTVVRLSSNEIGIVIRKGNNPAQPVVRMFIDENGTAIEGQSDLDLGEDEVQGRVVAGVVEQALYDLGPEMIFS